MQVLPIRCSCQDPRCTHAFFADQLLCYLEISLMLAGWLSLVQQAIPSIVIDPWYETERQRQSSLRRCMHGGTTLWSSTSRNIAYITSTILTDPYGAKDKIVKVGIIESLRTHKSHIEPQHGSEAMQRRKELSNDKQTLEARTPLTRTPLTRNRLPNGPGVRF